MTAHARSERTYRLMYGALSGLSGLTLAILITAGYPLLGVAGFVLILGAAAYLQYNYSGPLFDERDRQTHERAAGWTLTLFGWASAVFFPMMTVLVALDYTTWPEWLVPIALLVPVVYGTYGVLLVIVRRQL
jgi:hypothetical protein